MRYILFSDPSLSRHYSTMLKHLSPQLVAMLAEKYRRLFQHLTNDVEGTRSYFVINASQVLADDPQKNQLDTS